MSIGVRPFALRFFALGFERVGGGVVFVEDVRELGGVEDLAAELALDELDVLLAGDDADLGMFARCRHRGEAVELLEFCLCPNRLSIEKFGGRCGATRRRGGLPRAIALENPSKAKRLDSRVIDGPSAHLTL